MMTVAVVLKVTVLFLLALAVDWLFRGASASVRHLTWTVAVGATLALPVATLLTPGLSMPVPGIADRLQTLRLLPATERPPPQPKVTEAAPARSTSEPSLLRGTGGASTVQPSPVPVDGRGHDPARETQDESASLLVWGMGAGLVLLWLAASWARVWWVGREATPFGEGRVRTMARRVAAEVGLGAPPQLLRGPAQAMPATLGVVCPRILLPAGAEDWDDARLQAVLAHELAHVRRRDCPVQLLAGLACALYWYHPLAWLAARRLRILREFACDDEVIQLGIRASGYAACLLELARTSRAAPLVATVSTAVAQPGGVADRIHSVLSQGVARRRLTRRHVLTAAGLALALTAPISAVRAATPQEPRPVAGQEAEDPFGCWVRSVPRDMSVHQDDSGWEIRRESSVCTSEIRVRSGIEFTSDFSWISRMDARAVVRVDETVNGVRRTVEFRQGGNGVEVAFWRDGTPADLDSEARRWITVRLRTVLRQTGLAAERRVASILAEKGVDGVLAEVEIISPDDPQSLYLRELIERGDLSAAELEGVLRMAGRLVGSDGSLSVVLVTAARRHRAWILGPIRGAFLEAAERVGSDGDHIEMLENIVRDARGEDRAVRDAVLTLALESAQHNVGSDGDMADFLIGLGRRDAGRLEEGLIGSRFRDALRTVGSDEDEARVRRALGIGR